MKKLITSILFAVIAVTAGAQKTEYRNPVIPGYHPDPSVCRVGSDFYLVNSSFQYFPGVPLYHSKDMIHWELVGNILDRESQLPLKGASSWLGIYAPTIRYHEGTFYMITTNVGNGGNFMVKAQKPEGPWSEPIWLSQQGIDPSLFWEDGKCYMMSNPNDCIMLCEIDENSGKQLTESKPIWRGTGGRYPEGPHIYKKDGYYYLLISEGGTELAHKLTIARAKDIYGPYEGCPQNPILTNCNQKGQTKQIQGTGHGDLVQAEDGSWWITFLAYRNFGGSYHHLGRETFVAPVEWKDGEWPVINEGNPIDTVMTARLLPQQGAKGRSGKVRADFDAPLGPEFIYLQNPIKGNYKIHKGSLKLTAHGELGDNFQPTFVGIRQESPKMRVETEIKMSRTEAPYAYGLTVYQINDGHFDFLVSNHAVMLGVRLKSINAMVALAELPKDVSIVRLRVESDGDMYRFLYSTDGGQSYAELAAQNCSLLSTEVAGGFTGVTIGMTSITGIGEFTYFDYTEL